MPDLLSNVVFGISGTIGNGTLYGHNQYGPWLGTKTWTHEQWEGLDGPRVNAVLQLAELWRFMLPWERNTWTSYAKKQKLPNYTAFVKFNMPRVLHGQDPLSTYPG
jgi:hypothetical protein